MQSQIVLALLVLAGLFGSSAPALAIPSPELVVGSLTSLSQLAAIGSALIGGGAVAIGARAGGARLKRMALVFGGLSILLFGGNIYQWRQHAAAERSRLEATLLRPTAKRDGGATLDPLLKEIPYDKQLTHPLGLSTEAAAPIVADVEAGRATPWMILDIRETAETEMGTFTNAKTVRFPDIATSAVDLTQKRALLICHNGNRSAETCAALAAKGVDCRFIVGGLEKWITEKRSIGSGPVRGLGEIRAIPDYRNHGALLTTADVRSLADTEGAAFVDVRYPGEFSAGHIPDAINLPIRPTPTPELRRRIAALPQKPIVAPCYDRRSCFFAEILGLEVARAGGDFRGRYTAPWEYFTPPRTPPYVAAYIAEESKSTWQHLREAVQHGLAWGAHIVGLPLALFCLALLSRLLVLPFSLKAEKDQITSRLIADELERIKAATRYDPQRRSRAIRQLYRTHGMTPGRNLIALLFLPVLALSVEASVQVARAGSAHVLWLTALAEPDPYFLLPVVFSVLLCLYVDWALVTTRVQRLAVWLALAPLLFVAGAILPAAADLYVIFSGLLLLIQRAIVTRLPARLAAAWASRIARLRDGALARRGIFSLDARHALLASGNKAYRLALMREGGLPVPQGYVLTDLFLRGWDDLPERERRRVLMRIARRLGCRRFAVRSSGSGEDGAEASFAGVFESVLDAERSGLAAAVGQVLSSFASARAQSYGEHGPGRNILIQPMVPASFAGVLFTRAPDAPGAMLIEAVQGSGEALVSGRATPFSFKAGRQSGRLFGGDVPPYIDVAPLVALARRIESLFDSPQDIEWAYADGAFHVLQSRDITTISDEDALLDEWRRLSDLAECSGADDAVFVQTPMCELLPRPTPVSLSLLNDLWRSGGSADLALRGLGLNAGFSENGSPLYVSVQGLLYANAEEEAARRPELTALALRRIRKSAETIADDFETRWVAESDAHMRYLDAADYSRLDLGRLVTLIGDMRERFVTRTYVDAETINIVAQIFSDDMRAAFKDAGLDPLDSVNGRHATRLSLLLDEAAHLEGAERDEALRSAIGHRAHFDYELHEPRFGESAAALRMAAQALRCERDGAAPEADVPVLTGKLARLFERAHRFETLKEDAKHLALREFAHLRYAIRAAGNAADLGDAIFFLTLDEIARLDWGTAGALGSLARSRLVARDALQRHPPPPAVITAGMLERGPQADSRAAENTCDFKGTRVSGREPVTGRARVMSRRDAETGAPIEGFVPGDILVTPMLHPAWLPELVVAGGAVSEVGGWLSHMAIVARERGVAMITGVKGVETIGDGTEITLESDGRITVASERPRQAMAAE